MTDIEIQLCQVIGQEFGTDVERIMRNVESPDWSIARKSHDWRNHVPCELIGLWGRLSVDARLSIVFVAHELASSEKWE